MKVVCDLECNGLNPTRIWCVVAKDVETHKVWEFTEEDQESFREFASGVKLWIGHNFLCFDRRVLRDLWGIEIPYRRVIDTLICSRMFRRILLGEKHGLDAWGRELGMHKVQYDGWDEWSPLILSRCKRDVEINHRVYESFRKQIWDSKNGIALRLEHDTALICEELHETGFGFDIEGARSLRNRISSRLDILSGNLQQVFPPRVNRIKEITPRRTLKGDLHRGDFRWIDGSNLDISNFTPDWPFTRIEFIPFNPGSHKDVIDVLWKANWNPYEKTKGHKKAEKEGSVTEEMARYGWVVNEANLSTLPEDAPEASRSLTEWLMFEGRRRILETWINAYDEDTGRIHGRFINIGSWTHRKSHADPNMANVPSSKSKYKEPKLEKVTVWLGHTMRSLWRPREGWVLVGVDADQIQLRILSHLMGDENFQNPLVNGNKEESTDVHSKNAKILGTTREDAKNWIYAFCLGAGIPKLASMCRKTVEEMNEGLKYFYENYPGLRELKEKQLREEAKREYVELIDGRRIWCPNAHLALAAHLQGNESVIMKYACRMWRQQLYAEKGLQKGIDVSQVNDVHDEWQTEVREDNDLIRLVADTQTRAIRIAGEELGLRCPLKGDAKVGYNWNQTH